MLLLKAQTQRSKLWADQWYEGTPLQKRAWQLQKQIPGEYFDVMSRTCITHEKISWSFTDVMPKIMVHVSSQAEPMILSSALLWGNSSERSWPLRLCLLPERQHAVLAWRIQNTWTRAFFWMCPDMYLCSWVKHRAMSKRRLNTRDGDQDLTHVETSEGDRTCSWAMAMQPLEGQKGWRFHLTC